MKKIKELLSLLLCSAMMVSAVPSVLAEDGVKFSEDFEGTYTETWSSKLSGTAAGEDATGGVALIVNRPDWTGVGSWAEARTDLSENLPGDKTYKFSIDFKYTEGGRGYVSLHGTETNTDWFSPFGIETNYFCSGRTGTGKSSEIYTMTPDTWYRAVTVMQLNASDGTATKVRTKLYSLSGELLADSGDNTVQTHNSGYTFTNINRIRLTAYTAAADAPAKPIYFDNIVLEEVSIPEVTESNVTLKNASGTVQSFNSAEISTNTIAINFGMDMEQSTLTSSNIYINNASTNDTVPYTSAYADGVYTMTLQEELEENTRYYITITTAVQSAAGIAIENETAIPFKTELPEDIVYYETFDGTGETDVKNLFTSTEGNMGFVSGKSGNALGMRRRHEGQPSRVTYVFDNAVTEGKYKISYDMKFTLDLMYNYIEMTGTSSYYQFYLRKLSDDENYTLIGGRCGYDKTDAYVAEDALVPGAWYHIETTMDLDSSTAQMTMTDENGTVYEGTVHALNKYQSATDLSSGWTGFMISNFETTGGENEYTVFDNILIERVWPTPSVSAENVTFKAVGTVQSDLDAVNPATNTIEIDFGMDMDEVTLNSASIYVENAQTHEKVSHTSSYSDGVYTMNLSTALTQKTGYNLVLTTDVTSAKNVHVAENTSIAFTTSYTTITDDDAVVYEENFNDNKYSQRWTLRGSAATTGPDGSVALLLNRDGFDGSSTAEATLSKALTEDIYDVEITFKYNSGENMYFELQDSTTSKVYVPFAVLANTFRIGRSSEGRENTICNVSPDTWYKTKSTINLSEGTAKMILYSIDGVQLAASDTVSFTAYNSGFGLSKITGMRIFAEANAANSTSVYVDDIKITEVFSAPTVSASSVRIYTIDNEEITDFSSVSTLTNRIDINLGTKMKGSTITNENILLATSGGESVPFVLSASGKVISLSLSEFLQADTEYVLTLKSDLESRSGDTLGRDVTVKFVTGASIVQCDLLALSLNSEAVEGLSELSEGADATIDFDYKNSTGEAQQLNVIVAYYKGDALLRAQYVTENVPGTVTAETYKVNYEIGSLDGVTLIKVMVWDAFDKMHPLSDSIQIE